MTPPTPKDEDRRGLADDSEDRPLPGQPEDDALANPPEGSIPIGSAKETDVGDKPYPLMDAESNIAEAQDLNAYHEEGGPSEELTRENQDAQTEHRRESRMGVSPANPEEPTQEPSGKHTNQ